MSKKSDTHLILQDTWGEAGPLETLEQIADLTGKFMSSPVLRSPDGTFFHILREKGKSHTGIQEVYGQTTDRNKLKILARLVRYPNGIRVSINFVEGLLETSKEFRLADPPHPCDPGHREIWFEFHGEATPLGPSRENAFLNKMEILNDAARRLQAHIPAVISNLDLDKIYKEYSEHLNPVYPCSIEPANGLSRIIKWARQNYEFVSGQCSIAIVSSYPILTNFGTAIMAKVFIEKASSLGQCVRTQLTPQTLLDIALKAPGTVVIPAEKLTMGSNLYNIGSDVRAMFSSLNDTGKAVIFTGTYEELQSVLGGGQGGRSDPLEPVVRRIPDIPMNILVLFAVQSEGRRYGGLSRHEEEKIIKTICGVLENESPEIRYRLLPRLAACVMGDRSRDPADVSASLVSFRDRLKRPTETLTGLGQRPKIARSSHVQEHFLKVLDDPDLPDFFKSQILGQERALEQMITKLLNMILTGKPYEPLCYLAEGTTGTGKSESARLLARALGIPLKSIDAASLADHYSANAKLRGSGRGIVGSYESGVLEKAAKDHLGVVVEVRDLDHAPTHIRKNLAAEFLQVLEDGEAETGTGAIFSCANLIFAFTINLPDGKDEKLRRGLGFGRGPTRSDIESDVIKETKSLFSPAFMGRVGEPILFEDLGHETLAAITEKTIVTSIQTIARRYGVFIGDVMLENGLGMAIVVSSHLTNAMLGARSFIQRSRSMVGKAFRRIRHSGVNPEGKNLTVCLNPEGNLEINIVQPKKEINHE
jgi:AAA domain (Cdc48 subfamily)